MPRVHFENIAEVLERLGGIDPRRVLAWPAAGRATERDLLRVLEHEDRVCELVDGVLVEKIMGLKESALAGDILWRIKNFVDPRDLGLVTPGDGPLRLLSGLVRLPDVSFISWEQLPTHDYPDEPIPSLYPDLAVEVLSEGNTPGEMKRKLKEYFLAGTQLAWIVDPKQRTVTVHTAPDVSVTLTEKDTLDGGDVLPDFRLPVKELFARVKKQGGRKNGHSRRKS
jgi:Uma2 family endonuclease